MTRKEIQRGDEVEGTILGYRVHVHHCTNLFDPDGDIQTVTYDALTIEEAKANGIRLLGEHLHRHMIADTGPCQISADPVYERIRDEKETDGFRLVSTEVLIPLPSCPMAPRASWLGAKLS